MEKSVMSAIALIPPEYVWPQIQDIRQKHDKQIHRWMPHINLIYPFVEEKHFDECLLKVDEALKTNKSFNIAFTKDSFDHFSFGKSSTIFLKPLQSQSEVTESGTHTTVSPGVMDVHSQLLGAFPQCTDLDTKSPDGYHPHLSLGQFPTAEVDTFKKKFVADWQDIHFQVKDVSMISRADKDDPFHVRKYVQLS